jgi:hypothetical protein
MIIRPIVIAKNCDHNILTELAERSELLYFVAVGNEFLQSPHLLVDPVPPPLHPSDDPSRLTLSNGCQNKNIPRKTKVFNQVRTLSERLCTWASRRRLPVEEGSRFVTAAE